MTTYHLFGLLPLIILAAASVLLMLVVAVKRNHRLVFAVSLAGIAAAFITLWPLARHGTRIIGSLLVIDSFSILYMGLILPTAAAVVLFAYDYLDQQHEHKEEFYILVLLATLGGMTLVASNHFASFLLGLEVLSVALYALIAYIRTGALPLEAGIKYLVLASSSAAFLLFGMALIYEEVGSLQFGPMAAALTGSQPLGRPIIFFAGAALVFTGVGFKLALVPFHLWTPDVYEGAPLPVTVLIATVSKASVFGLLLRWIHPLSRPGSPLWTVLAISAIASMLAGNLLALLQTNVKRILAYSSIAHMGYFLVALLAGGALGLQAATYYLIAYLVTISGALGVLTMLSTGDEESCAIDDYRGLFWRRPVVAGVLTAMLFSLAGIPLTAGFLGKFYVIAAGASAASWGLVFVLIVSSVIGLFYYLRVVVALYAADDGAIFSERSTSLFASRFCLTALTVLLVCFGVWPGLLWPALTAAAESLR
jgi:NADH-quinone oxidoreductase subunit N